MNLNLGIRAALPCAATGRERWSLLAVAQWMIESILVCVLLWQLRRLNRDLAVLILALAVAEDHTGTIQPSGS